MYGLVILGCTTAIALRALWQYISNHDQDHVTEYTTSENNDKPRPSYNTTSHWNSRRNNNDSHSSYQPDPASAYSKSFRSPTVPPPSSSITSSSLPKPEIPSSKVASSFSRPASSAKPPAPPSSSSSSSSQFPSVSTPAYSKPTLSPLPFDSTNQQTSYMWVHNGTSPLYIIPKEFENLIKKDIVPDVLKKPLSPSTYKDYFAALLYAEDFYVEKWSGFQLENVTLQLHEAAIYDKSVKNKNLKENAKKDDKIFVSFEIDSVPEKRPFLLSRDFVHARRSGHKTKEFRGILYRVVKRTTVLVEFGKEFFSQHRADCKYDISFSFNRVCLKRAHQAIAAASDHLFQNYIFPDCASEKNIPSSAPLFYSHCKLDFNSNSAVRQILSFQGQLPYLVEGQLCVIGEKLSKTGLVIREVVLQIYQKASKARILICAPVNITCDVLLASLKKEIPKSDMFRANAAFREVDGVPNDVLPLCHYKGECFSCPSLQELRQYNLIFSTFVSSFRLRNEGINAGHFSHIFLLDASSATEPEVMVALSNLANQNTTVIVTGAPNNRSGWVRSDIARRNGLSKSYFERLRASKTYGSSDPMLITQL